MRSKQLQEDLDDLVNYIETLHLAGSTIMITGATGLIGSLIIKAFIEYNDCHDDAVNIIGMARNAQRIKMVFSHEYSEQDNIPNVKFICQDISDKIPEEIQCEYIIHTANPTSSQYFMTNPVEVIDNIYMGTKQILEFAMEKKVRGVVYLSSMEVFGQVSCDEKVSENQLGYIDIQNIRSCYSEGKRHAELMCKSYAIEYQVPVKVARLAQVFGAGVQDSENRVFAQFARSAIRGENIVLHTKGQSMGNYCYTTDAIKAILLLLTTGENGDVYTVVNEDTTRTIADMATLVAENFSKDKIKIIVNVPKGNELGYAPDTRLKLNANKLRQLGWKAERNLLDMYERMIPDLDNR